MELNEFDVDSGELSFDFANTLGWREGEKPEEGLTEYAELVRWGEAADLLSAERADQLRTLAGANPKRAAAVFAEAIALREAIYRIFAAVAEEREVDTADLAVLNQATQQAMPHLRIGISGNKKKFGWQWQRGEPRLEEVLWPVARAAGELLTSDKLGRVRRCADDRGCSYLFLDTSRNRSRRWCSMESCGNRAKAQRFYQRQKEQP